jgi:hypothetical protein
MMTTDRWAEAVDRSRESVLAAGRTGRHAAAALAQATAARMVAAWTLAPAPVDPVAHVEAGHADARRHLVRLPEHGPRCDHP